MQKQKTIETNDRLWLIYSYLPHCSKFFDVNVITRATPIDSVGGEEEFKAMPTVSRYSNINRVQRTNSQVPIFRGKGVVASRLCDRYENFDNASTHINKIPNGNR